ncbi:Thymidylate kinase [Cordyceps fumosorosea ARSEF 2679]|uniref:Thymidylate kinase n=1 Tax=Cordyceps fumosorosea (strain ARSEF 2679) TaxID=1081104 RepID=A0A167PZV5_CORFA|nr:Thymidylate kinase [Cordyceps fumosorosea ARSEF 2679]OAA57169.1 Thymidylate kinase [Cordyceps fumosorosea ARSEF 2679]
MSVAEEKATTAKPERGAFIVLEGLDRSGKTTQVKLLEQRLLEQRKSVKLMRFPDRTTPIGKTIDSYLKSAVRMDDHAIHLLFSANRWEAAETINELLDAGTTVVCDRYAHSGMVYSAAKRSPALRLGWARAPDAGLPRPDRVVFLDLDEEAARARGGWGEEVYEKAAMQREVRRLFGALAGKAGEEEGEVWKEQGLTGGEEWLREKGDLVLVDAGGTVEEVAEKVWRVVEDVKGQRRVLL